MGSTPIVRSINIMLDQVCLYYLSLVLCICYFCFIYILFLSCIYITAIINGSIGNGNKSEFYKYEQIDENEIIKYNAEFIVGNTKEAIKYYTMGLENRLNNSDENEDNI